MTAVFPQFRRSMGILPSMCFSFRHAVGPGITAYVLISYAKYYGYPSNLAEQPGIMIIDEIDAHLHPTAQQRVIPIPATPLSPDANFLLDAPPSCWSVSSLGKSNACNGTAMVQ